LLRHMAIMHLDFRIRSEEQWSIAPKSTVTAAPLF
jgi:hypothetical protein